MKLDVVRLGIALGIVWGAGCLFLGWAAAAFGWGAPIVELAGTFYIGFAPTLAGGLIGGLWGFADGLIGGLLIAWIYNVIPLRT
jgi:hypothetical protein